MELRTRRAAGESLKSLAEAFNTIPEYVSCIVTGRIHKQLGGPTTKAVMVPASKRQVEFEGVTLLESEWAENVGLPRSLVRVRLSRGWSAQTALSVPVRVPPSAILVPSGPSIAYVTLTEGYFACIDVDVIPLVENRRWYTAQHPQQGKAYPGTHSTVEGKPGCLSLRTVVLGGKPTTAYAVNGKNLDCRRANLRDVSKAQSSWRNARRSDNKTGITGAYWVKEKKRFIAKLKKNGILAHIGSFLTIEEAGAALDQAALRLRGEFALLQQTGVIS